MVALNVAMKNTQKPCTILSERATSRRNNVLAAIIRDCKHHTSLCNTPTTINPYNGGSTQNVKD
jgi:hypothetical protein